MYIDFRNPRTLTEEARVRSQDSPCTFCGGESGSSTGFSLNTSVYSLSALFQQCSILAYILILLSVRGTSGWSLGTFQKVMFFRKSKRIGEKANWTLFLEIRWLITYISETEIPNNSKTLSLSPKDKVS